MHLKHPPASLSLTCGTAALCTRVKPRLLSASLPCGPHCQALLFLSRTAHPLSAVGFLIDGWYRFAPSDHLVSRPSHLDQRPTAPDSNPARESSPAAVNQREPLDLPSTVHACGISRARARILPWPWTVRSRIDGPGSPTSLESVGFPILFKFQTELIKVL